VEDGMFSLNEKVVYPGHGVARINRLIKKIMAGKESTFYELAFLSKDVTVLVPTQNAEAVGLRPLSSQEHIKTVLAAIKEPVKRVNQYEPTASNWNKRNKEYQAKLRTGSIKDLLEIYRDLRSIATYKELSFGEKNLLHQAEALLVEEIALVRHMATESVLEELRNLYALPRRKNQALFEQQVY
jgi:CarD family transcriptional regulator